MADWSVLGESSNPIPGDPEEVAALGRQLRDTADMIKRQSANIKNLTTASGWDSDAGDKFRKMAGDTADKLLQAYDRYDASASALGESVDYGNPDRNWASALYHAQDLAKKALNKAENAHAESTNAQRAIDQLPKDGTAAAAHSHLANTKSTADGDLAQAKRDLQNAVDFRDQAASRAATRIENVIGHDPVKDTGWDRFKKHLEFISHLAGVVAAVAGVLSLVLGWVPILGQLLVVVAAVASVVAFLADLTLAIAGDGNWVDVGIDLLGVLSLGAGRLIGDAVKGASLAAKGEVVARDALLLREAGASSDDALEMAADVSKDFENGEKAQKAIDDGPASWIPKGKSLFGLCRPMKGMFKAFGGGWKDAKAVWHAEGLAGKGKALWNMHSLGDPEIMKGIKTLPEGSSAFRTTAIAGNRAWWGSQAGAIGMGWANLSPGGLPLENSVDEPNLFGSVKGWADTAPGG